MKRVLAVMALVAPLVLFTSCGAVSTKPFVGSIHNFGKIDDHTYRGTQPYGKDYEGLKKLGIKTIINLRNDSEPDEVIMSNQAGLRNIRIPMSSHSAPSILSIQAALTAIRNPDNWPVYVHCEGGRHRTGVVIAAYRVTDFGWNKEKAWAEAYKYDYYRTFDHGSIEDWFMQKFNPSDILPGKIVNTK